MTTRAIIVVADLMARSRLEGAARATGLTPEVRRRLGAPDDEAPALVVIDLDAATALDDVPAWRERWPSLAITGFVSHTDRERWAAAESLGVRVVPRGATASAERTIFRDATS